tara:strand:- start:2572 stop:3627 length:1056 start_codon:yes stop_codon:yes gene_type:complete
MRLRLFYALIPIIAFLILFEYTIINLGLGFPRSSYCFNERLMLRRPNSSYINYKDQRNIVHLNNFGFHDKNREKTNDDKKRIVFIGDSFVEGAQVSVDSLFSTRIEKYFNSSNDSSFEIINCGVGGVGTAWQYVLWDEYIRDNLSYDHIILFFLPDNDLRDNHPKLSSRRGQIKIYLDKNGFPKIEYMELSSRIKLFNYLSSHSAIFNSIRQRLFVLRKVLKKNRTGDKKAFINQKGIRSRNDDNYYQESLIRTKKLMKRWINELQNDDIGFSIVYLENIEDKNNMQEKNIGLNLKNIVADSSHFFNYKIQDGLIEKALFKKDKQYGHYTNFGHKIISEEIFFWIKNAVDR